MNLRNALRIVLGLLPRPARAYDLDDALTLDGAELERWLRDRDARGETAADPRDRGRAEPTPLVDAA